jgi:hypothetical protein
LSQNEERMGLYRQAVTIIASNLNDEDKQIDELRKIGFDADEARRITSLAPSALSRPIIEELGDVDWCPRIAVGDREFLLERQPEYQALLLLARFHRQHGFFDHDSFKTVAGSSAEIDAVSKALNSGKDLDGSTIATAVNDSSAADYLIP